MSKGRTGSKVMRDKRVSVPMSYSPVPRSSVPVAETKSFQLILFFGFVRLFQLIFSAIVWFERVRGKLFNGALDYFV